MWYTKLIKPWNWSICGWRPTRVAVNANYVWPHLCHFKLLLGAVLRSRIWITKWVSSTEWPVVTIYVYPPRALPDIPCFNNNVNQYGFLSLLPNCYYCSVIAISKTNILRGLFCSIHFFKRFAWWLNCYTKNINNTQHMARLQQSFLKQTVDHNMLWLHLAV